MRNENAQAGKLPLLMLLLPAAFIVIFSASVFIHQSPGFRVDKTQFGLRVNEVYSTVNQVEKGDLIIRINDLAYNRILSHCLGGTLKPFSESRVVVLRGERQINLQITPAPVMPFEFISASWPHFVLIAVLLSLGTLSFLRAPSDQPTTLFLAMVCFFATTFSATFPSHFGILDPFIISLSFFTLALCNWMAFGACLHFIFKFPGERNLVRDRKWLVAAFYLTPALVPLCGALIAAGSADAYWGWLQRFRNITLPFMAVLAFAKHLFDYRNIRSAIEKNQVKIITSAYWLSFGPYMILYLMPNILFNDPYIPFRFVVISGTILPAAYFIALIRYRLMDVDKMISRTVSYFLLIALLTLSYSYLVIILKRHFIGSEPVSEEVFLIYLILVALLFQPVMKLISRVLDRFFLPKDLCGQDRVLVLNREIATCLRFDDMVTILTHRMLKEILVTRSGLAVLGPDQTRIYGSGMDADTVAGSVADLKTYFRNGRDYAFVKRMSSDPVPEKMGRLERSRIELVFCLRGGTGMLGFLLLGPRRDGRVFTRQDIRMFATIAGQAGVALENVRHYESLNEGKKQLEQMFAKVVKAEKMAALGEMSAVVAHELKNPLGIIRSSAQYLKNQIKDPLSAHELLEYIIGEVDGLTRVIDNMMGLARYRRPEFAAVDLKQALPGLIKYWDASENHRPEIKITLTVDDHLPVISADFNQLQQVFLNCITNAEDAMPDRGTIHVRAQREDEDDILVRITDTGPGIPPDQMDNVFKQFFTTKEKGMGIGLSVSRQIIQAHGGIMEIENLDGKGLEVRLHLPVNPWPGIGPPQEHCNRNRCK